MRIVGLPMYDLPGVGPVLDRWWTGLREHLLRAGFTDLPTRLYRTAGTESLWRHPELLLAEACGFPYRFDYRRSWRLVATPTHDAPGCEGAWYRSLIVIGADSELTDLETLPGRVAAINEPRSHSGCNALRAALAPVAPVGHPLFRRVEWTGGHVASLRAVAEARADLCAVDCVTHALLQRHRPDLLAGTRGLAWTPSAPGLPYVTRASLPEAWFGRLREAVAGAFGDPRLAAVRGQLLMSGVAWLEDSDYQRIDSLARSGASVPLTGEAKARA